MKEEKEKEDIIDYLKSVGVTHIRDIPNIGLCGLSRFLYTTGLCCIMTKDGGGDFYQYRYCYPNHSDAIEDITTWDGNDHPNGYWIKLKGIKDNVYMDYSNPKYITPE